MLFCHFVTEHSKLKLWSFFTFNTCCSKILLCNCSTLEVSCLFHKNLVIFSISQMSMREFIFSTKTILFKELSYYLHNLPSVDFMNQVSWPDRTWNFTSLDWQKKTSNYTEYCLTYFIESFLAVFSELYFLLHIMTWQRYCLGVLACLCSFIIHMCLSILYSTIKNLLLHSIVY